MERWSKVPGTTGPILAMAAVMRRRSARCSGLIAIDTPWHWSIPHSGSVSQYIYRVPWSEVALVIARWQPASLRAEVAVFAKTVVTEAAPTSAVRAKALLFAAGKLGTFATSVGVELAPELALSPSL